MTIDMDLEMNNDAQALNNIFSIGVAYKMDDKIHPEYDKLPQTGDSVNSYSFIALALISAGMCTMLNKKSKEGEGDNYNE